MATQKKTTKPKSNTKDVAVEKQVQSSAEVVLNEIKASVAELSEDTTSATVEPLRKIALDPTDMITCRSLYLGKLVYVSPTNGARYVWANFGKTERLSFGELQTMNNHKPQYLNTPLLFIDDSQVVEYFNLTPVYKKVANINKLEATFSTGNLTKIRKSIQEAIDVDMREMVISKVRKMREEGTLVNIDVIKVLEEELKIVIE